jgi:hypothetical protein
MESHRMKSKGIFLAAALALSPAAAAQESPAPPGVPLRVNVAPQDGASRTSKSDKAWARLVESFANALVEGDQPAVEGLMTNKSYIRRFEGGEFESAEEMLGRISRSTLVGQHAYFHPALVMAADVAADFKQATAVPEKVRASFLIDDQTEMKRANATAVQWVMEQLQVKHGSPVAVIVLWAPKLAAPAPAEEPADAKPNTKANEKAEPQPEPQTFEPVFVILRGEEIDTHRFRINYVVYGNPIVERD